MSSNPAIIFIHHHLFGRSNRLPAYLVNAIESARVFNPDSQILLLTSLKTDLDWLGVERVDLATMGTDRLKKFHEAYRHISTYKPEYERFCFERWFYIEAVWEKLGLAGAMAMDSDTMFFGSAQKIFDELRPQTMLVDEACPSSTVLGAPPVAFNDFVVQKFCDPEFVRARQHDLKQAIDRGEGFGFNDMYFLDLIQKEGTGVQSYPTELKCGRLDGNINVPGEFVPSWRWRNGRWPVKRMYWQIEAGCLVPYLRRRRSATMIRVLVMHFQSGAKRLMRRFNPLAGRSPASNRWHAWFYNYVVFKPRTGQYR
ncbi:hypothetical protein GC207_07240 [bacterium]|nr:hypothetical protein [bacterium]